MQSLAVGLAATLAAAGIVWVVADDDRSVDGAAPAAVEPVSVQTLEHESVAPLVCDTGAVALVARVPADAAVATQRTITSLVPLPLAIVDPRLCGIDHSGDSQPMQRWVAHDDVLLVLGPFVDADAAEAVRRDLAQHPPMGPDGQVIFQLRRLDAPAPPPTSATPDDAEDAEDAEDGDPHPDDPDTREADDPDDPDDGDSGTKQSEPPSPNDGDVRRPITEGAS